MEKNDRGYYNQLGKEMLTSDNTYFWLIGVNVVWIEVKIILL